MAQLRQDQWLVTATVDGVSIGIFDKMTGGEITSEETKYAPGGMQPQVSLGGMRSVENVTISRLARGEDDVHWLFERAGRADMSVTRQPLDADGNAYGRPVTYSGKLQGVTPAEIDSESSDAALLELEMAPSGSIA